MSNDKANSNNDRKKALVIAVSDYDNSSGLKSIEFCKNDGKEIYDILKKNGYDIPDSHKLIGYVESERLKKVIYDFFTNGYNKPDDTLVFYYSGHGIPDRLGKIFLAPSDMDSDHPLMTGFSFDDLTDSMLLSNSQRIVTILDSCFSGSLKISKSKGLDSKSGEEAATRIANNTIEEKSDKLKQGHGRCLLAASQGYEEAYDRQEKDHSIFTYYLLEGLKGHKNAVDDEGNVTYDTLGKFITREIGNLPPEKRPKQTPVRKGEVAGGEIVLANYPDLRKTRESDYFTLFGKGENYYRRRRYKEALECYDSILKLKPKDEDVLLRKGDIFLQLNDDKKALECFDQVIKLNKNSSDAWYYKAKLNIKIKDYENALKCLDKDSNINPDDERVWDGYKKIKSIMRSDREKEKQEDIISPPEIQKTDVSVIDTLADKQHHPSKGNIYGGTQLKTSEDIAEQAIKKEEKEKRKYNQRDSSRDKPSQGIFGSVSKPIEERKKTDVTNTNITAPPTPIKTDIEKPQQKKDTLPPSNLSIGTIGSGGVPSPPKYTAPEYDNNKRKYTERDSSRQSQGINLKLIIIPIIAVAIIGVIVGISYFNLSPPDTIETVTSPDTVQQYQFIRAWGSNGTGDGEFISPRRISVDSSGNVYVDDRGNNRIQKFDSNGTFITKWGSNGTGDGEEFYYPAVGSNSIDSSSGYVYVTDTDNNRIQKFDSNGTFITKWGSNGTGDGEFNDPSGIAVDPSNGYVYVVDTYNQRIQKFDSNGTFIKKWGSNGTGDGDGEFSDPYNIAVDPSTGNVYIANESAIKKFDSNGNFITKWVTILDSYDLGKDFYSPIDIAVEPSTGNVYIAEESAIKKFDSNGTFITEWGSEGRGDGEFSDPSGIAVDPSNGYVYVADTGNNRIQKFDSNGTFITKLGYGYEDGEFYFPSGIAVDSSKGNVYVTDSSNRIQKFDSNGTFITKWGSNGTGDGDGEFSDPYNIAVDPSTGNVYVADTYNQRIQKFDSNGTFITEWGSEGRGVGEFYFPRGIAVDSSNGYVYVADTYNQRIQKFDSNGTFITTRGGGYGIEFYPETIAVDSSTGNVYILQDRAIQKFDSNGNFITKWYSGYDEAEPSYPSDIAVDPSNGYVYVGDANNDRIQKFDSNGNLITKWGSNGSGDGEFLLLAGIAVDSSTGNVYVTDTDNNRIQVFATATK